MRIKSLLRYDLSTSIPACLIFFGIFLTATLFGTVAVSVSTNVVFGVITESNGEFQTWTSSVFSFIIFMIITSLILSQKETRFLITRSVSRKEIFAVNSLYLAGLSAAMTVLQMIIIHIDALSRSLITGDPFRGLGLDIQSTQAANMTNPLIFFLVGFSMLFSMSALAYFIGSCMARWRILTICVLSVGFIVFVACFSIPGFLNNVESVWNFMFTDESNGIWIMLKHIALAVLALGAAFPVMRRITAAKSA
jgi:hypothetical protein